jgi:hypothetical protein
LDNAQIRILRACSQRPPAIETTVTRPITDLTDVHFIRRQSVLDGSID